MMGARVSGEGADFLQMLSVCPLQSKAEFHREFEMRAIDPKLPSYHSVEQAD